MDGNEIGHLVRAIERGDESATAELRETHISWVILCGDFAYKIKKPVNFGFLDFSSLERRRHFCHEELRLNRRFSPELYLAVVCITQGEQGPELEGGGTAIDYAVKMRRFNEEQLLDVIAARGELDTNLLRALAREFARLHEALPSCRPAPDGTGPGTPAALLAAIVRLAGDPSMRARMAAAARSSAEQRFGVERMVTGYEAALRAAIEHRRLA